MIFIGNKALLNHIYKALVNCTWLFQGREEGTGIFLLQISIAVVSALLSLNTNAALNLVQRSVLRDERICFCMKLGGICSEHLLTWKQRWALTWQMQASVERTGTERLVGGSWQGFPAIGFTCIFPVSCSFVFDDLFIHKHLSSFPDPLACVDDRSRLRNACNLFALSLISVCTFGSLLFQSVSDRMEGW